MICKWHTEELDTLKEPGQWKKHCFEWCTSASDIIYASWLRGVVLGSVCRGVSWQRDWRDYRTNKLWLTRLQHLSTFEQREKQTHAALTVSPWELRAEHCCDGWGSTISKPLPGLPRVNLSAQDTVPPPCWNEQGGNWAIYICATLWLWTDYATAKHALHNQLWPCTPPLCTLCSQIE